MEMYKNCNTNSIPVDNVNYIYNKPKLTKRSFVMKKQKTDLITIRCTKEFKESISKRASEHSQTTSTYIVNQLSNSNEAHFTQNITIKQELLEKLDVMVAHTTNNHIKNGLQQIANTILEEL